jgi:2-polyprenyl-3-methyl-5-hydroxy-6-metoxy-1,4-benzoquinol methylase
MEGVFDVREILFRDFLAVRRFAVAQGHAMSGALSAFWDRACLAKGHTGYGDPLLHRYDQPIRLATVGRVLDHLFPQGMSGRVVLDIGCGTGDFIALSRRRGADVMGVDISPVVLERARQRFAGDERVQLEVGAIRDLNLAASSFDVVTSVTVLQHVLDDGEFVRSLQALRETLRPGGRMILLELAPPHESPVAIKDVNGFVYLLERPPHAWRSSFERAGLTVVEEPVFPQLGIALLRGLGWLIGALKGSTQSAGARGKSDGVARQNATGSAPTTSRSLKQQIIQSVRRSLLVLAWPFDHVLRLPLPALRRRHYRVFVLERGPLSS